MGSSEAGGQVCRRLLVRVAILVEVVIFILLLKWSSCYQQNIYNMDFVIVTQNPLCLCNLFHSRNPLPGINRIYS